MLIRKYLNFFLGGTERFQNNFLKIASASLAAQIIGLLFLPVLTRLYSPEDFGTLTSYTMVQSVGLAFVTSRLDWIIPNSKTQHQARELLSLGFLVAGLLSLGSSLLIWMLRDPVAGLLKFPDGQYILAFIPIALMAGAVQLLLQSWFVRAGNLSSVGWAKLLQSISTIAISLLLGVIAIKFVNGLIVGYVTGFIAAAVLLGIKAPTVFSRLTHLKLRNVKRRLKVYGPHMMSSTALSLVNMAMNMSLIVLIITFYDNKILGWYGLVFRVATAPIGLITTGLVQSFWSDAAILVKTDPAQLKKFYKQSTKRLCVLAIPMTIIFLMAPLYIPLIFGADDWSGAGLILVSVTPYLFGMIVFSSTTHLIVYNKAHWQLFCDATALIISIIVFSVVVNYGGQAHHAIFASSCIMLLGYIARYNIHIIANKRSEQKVKSLEGENNNE